MVYNKDIIQKFFILGDIDASEEKLLASYKKAGPQHPAMPTLATLEAIEGEKAPRVLAIGSRPDFLVDYAYCENDEVEHFDRAVAWALGLIELTRGPQLILDQLRAIMGEGVRELTAEDKRRERIKHGGISTILGLDI